MPHGRAPLIFGKVPVLSIRATVGGWRRSLRLVGPIACLAALSRPALADTAQVTPQIQIDVPSVYRLENGLQVVLERDTRQPEIALLVGYNVGTRDDPAGQQGLAHLVEHMSYRGSRHLKAYDALAQLQRAGATEINGMTGPDATLYFVSLPREALTRALWVESERMAFTLERFSESSLALERTTVTSELLLSSEAAEWRFGAQMRRALFGEKHPYAPLLEPAQTLSAIQLADVRTFFRQGYRPDNAQLILVGDFDLSTAKAQIDRYFGPIRNPQQPLGRALVAPPHIDGPRELKSQTAFASEQLTLSWLLPPLSPQEQMALRVLRRIWQRQLERQLLAEQQIAAKVELSVEWFDLATRFAINVTAPHHGKAGIIMTSLAGYVVNFWKTDFKAELARAVRAEGLSIAMLCDQPLSRAFAHWYALRNTGAPFNAELQLKLLRALQGRDVAALERRINRNSIAVGWFLQRETKTQ